MSITRAQRARFHDYAPTPDDIEAVMLALDTATDRLSNERAKRSRAEHRAVRAEAQSETRRQQTAYWQETAEVFEARIQAVRELHRRFGVYEHEDACTDTTDEHREEHHHEDSDSIGEYYCDQMPLYAVCDHCRDEDGERADWPCPTIRALDGDA